jgi:hypothetical protein
MAASPRSTPPADLDAAGKAAWKRYRALLLERGVWDQSSPELLDELARALQDARGGRRRICRRVAELGDVPEARWVKGSRGQWVESPDSRLVHDSLAAALRIGEALLLTPAAARRAGVIAAGDAAANPFASFVADELAPRRKRSA